jgi:recombination protein RecR
MKPVSFGYLIDALKSLPGVGKKQAERIAYFLINKDEKYIDDLIQRIKNGKDNIHFCKQCNNFAEHELCDICSNQSRTQDKLCIVSTIEDLQKIEETNSYTGLYFVLNGEVDVKTKQTLNHIVIRQLMDLVRSHTFNEVIFATN